MKGPIAFAVCVGLTCPASALANETVRVSVDSDGNQASEESVHSRISGSGRFVIFTSGTPDLVSGDTNGAGDGFLHDLETGETRRITVSSAGEQGDGDSIAEAISPDGRWISFFSDATNLVEGDRNGHWDIFRHDAWTGSTVRVSVSSSGEEANGPSDRAHLSADGRYVRFRSLASNLTPDDTNGKWDVFVHDCQTAETTRVSVSSTGEQANGASENGSISYDGRFVSFHSLASNLVPGDTNGTADVFVHDRLTGETTRVNVASDGTQSNGSCEANRISGDGRFVAFDGVASNLVPQDTNGTRDVFVHDRLTGATVCASRGLSGTTGNRNSFFPAISVDGRFVSFNSRASDLVSGDTNGSTDCFVFDQHRMSVTRWSVSSSGAEGNDDVHERPHVSDDGRRVVFNSKATNLVSGDTNGVIDVFVRTRILRQPDRLTHRVSLDSNGEEALDHCTDAALSENGRHVVFTSRAANLVPFDLNGMVDVFVRDRLAQITTRVSVASDGGEGDADCTGPSVSADGRWVAFASAASTLVPDDVNGVADVFVHDRTSGTTSRVSVDSTGVVGDGPSGRPWISAAGTVVVFESESTNLVPGDTNEAADVFLHDRQTGETVRVSVDSAGGEGDGASSAPVISADGTRIAFESLATNLVPGDTNDRADLFVHDRASGETWRASVDSDGREARLGSEPAGGRPALSADGRWVAFASLSDDLVAGDGNGARDVFVHDLLAGETARVSIDSTGAEGDADSEAPALAADGRCVAFASLATNLVDADANGVRDVFLHDRISGETDRVSVDSAGDEAEGESGPALALSLDGRVAAFASLAADLVVDDGNGVSDVFVHGPRLTLDAAPRVARAGDLLVLGTWRGDLRGPAILFVTAVNGMPFVMPVTAGSFDPYGSWVVGVFVPANPALPGNEIELQVYAVRTETGAILTTNTCIVSFE